MAETYEIRIQGRFNAVHQLRMCDGAVEPLHGHDWRVEVVFRGSRLDEADLLIDFDRANEALRGVLARFEHQNLNALAEFAACNPSAERVARGIFGQLAELLGQESPLAGVYVEEAPGCVAGFLKLPQ